MIFSLTWTMAGGGVRDAKAQEQMCTGMKCTLATTLVKLHSHALAPPEDRATGARYSRTYPGYGAASSALPFLPHDHCSDERSPLSVVFKANTAAAVFA
jgi:hypothetical protein